MSYYESRIGANSIATTVNRRHLRLDVDKLLHEIAATDQEYMQYFGSPRYTIADRAVDLLRKLRAEGMV